MTTEAYTANKISCNSLHLIDLWAYQYTVHLDFIRPHQLQYQGFIQRGKGQELKAVQALDHGESRLMDTAFRGSAFAIQQFQLGKTQQKARIIYALGRALRRHLVLLAQEGGQPQQFQMVLQQNLRRIVWGGRVGGAHRLTSNSAM